MDYPFKPGEKVRSTYTGDTLTVLGFLPGIYEPKKIVVLLQDDRERLVMTAASSLIHIPDELTP